jgi:hypothetical protein
LCAEKAFLKDKCERMTNGYLFFDRPILNSPHSYPERHWELDAWGQPTHPNNRDGAAWTGIPQRERRSTKQQ